MHRRTEAELKLRPYYKQWLIDENNVMPDDLLALSETNGELVMTHPEDEMRCPFAYLFERLRDTMHLAPESTHEEGMQALMEAGVLDESQKPIRK